MVMSTRKKRRTARWLTLPIAVILHVLVFGGLVIASFMTVESVPAPPITISFVAAAPPPPPPPPPPPRRRQTQTKKPIDIPKPEAIVQPTAIPEEVPEPIDAPEEEDFGEDFGVEGGVEGGVVGGVVGGVLGGILGGVDGGMLGEQPLYAGIGGVTNPELIPSSKTQPRYPEIARKAKVQGTVILQAIIHKNGTVGNVTVLKSPGPKFGFDEAAMAAVRQWRYKPGLQNGKPVDVYFTVVVDFVLQ